MNSPGERPNPARFPALPILSAGVPPSPRTQREKYGGLFSLGVAGLLLLVALVGWFGYGVWSNRDIWVDIYVVHDASRPETERVEAAFRLGENPRLSDAQKLEMSLKKDLPDLARYRLAEAVSTEAVAIDPRGYAMTVARSPGWPDWLRLVLARRLAYGASRGYDIPYPALNWLRLHSDPMIRLWATYGLAVLPHPRRDPARDAELEEAALTSSPNGGLAALLLEALHAQPRERERLLDAATVWLRRHHPQAAKIWQGWAASDQRVVPEGSP